MTREEFWNWFDDNKFYLEKFISAKNRDYTIYETLSDKLRQYNKFLIPELTIDEENNFVLVVSCDGMKEGIPFAEALTENLRNFDSWKILKYRQPGPMEAIPVNGLNLKRKSIFLTWETTAAQNYHITFFITGYSSYNHNYEVATLLHLDHTIGEYNAMTRIESIEIKKLGFFQSKKDLKHLDDLKKEIESNPV